MNQDFIISNIKPYLNSKKELTYENFEKLFSFLDRQEQYEVCNLLEAMGINLVEQQSVQDILKEKIPSANNPRKTTDTQKKSQNSNYKINLYKLLKEPNERLAILYQNTKSEIYIKALLIKNIKFLTKEAYSISKYYSHSFDHEELLQLAQIGFLKGCKNFNVTKGYHLLTYTHLWIKQLILHEIIYKGFMIRLPDHKWEEIRRISKLLSRCKNDEIENVLKRNNISPEKYNEVKRLKQQYLNSVSLDDQIGDCENVHLIDLISPGNYCLISKYETPEEVFEYKELINFVNYIIKTLSDKERDVIIMRYGLDSSLNEKKLSEIGKKFGVTKERIRQIERRAILKLTHLIKSKCSKDDEFIRNFLPEYKTELNENYFFKKDNISYIPDIYEIIRRIIFLYPKETSANLLYPKIKECALQNGYEKYSLSQNEIMPKIEYIQRSSNAKCN